MAKEKIKQITGVFASAFAYAGHISKEEAKEISGLADREFGEAYEKGSAIAQKVIETQGSKMDTFIEHFAKQIDEQFADFDGKLL